MSEEATYALPVLFVRDPESGEVVAIFTTQIGTADPNTRQCYSHVGQHASAHVDWITACPVATPDEARPLWRELQQIYADAHLVPSVMYFGAVMTAVE